MEDAFNPNKKALLVWGPALILCPCGGIPPRAYDLARGPTPIPRVTPKPFLFTGPNRVKFARRLGTTSPLNRTQFETGRPGGECCAILMGCGRLLGVSRAAPRRPYKDRRQAPADLATAAVQPRRRRVDWVADRHLGVLAVFRPLGCPGARILDGDLTA